MPVSVQWDNVEHSILRWTFVARWTWNDYFTHCVSIRHEINPSNRSFDAIVDLSASGRIPAGSLTAAREALMQSHKQLHTVVIIATSPMICSLYEVFSQLTQEMLRHSKTTLHLASTLDDAYALVNQHAVHY